MLSGDSSRYYWVIHYPSALWLTVKSLAGSLPCHMEAHSRRTDWLMPLWGITDVPCITKFHDEGMVKTKGVTLVALATLLAGFVASCTSAEIPSFDDIPSDATTITVEVDRD